MNNTINHECQLKKVEMWLSNICIGLNIFVITEQTIATLFARVLKVWNLMCQREPFCFFSKLNSSWKAIIKHGCLTFYPPVKSQSSSIIARMHHGMLLRKGRAKSSSLLEHREGRKQPAKESTQLKKDAYSRLQGLLLQKERVKLV